jgi:LacI family transcriptional regulator
MPTTIRDIAKKLNLSVSTVSYALNNGPRSVPEAVKLKVLELAKELDYRPNRIAKSMVTGRTYTIGIVPSDQFENFIISPFILQCMNGIINECERCKYDVLLFTRFGATEEFDISNSISDGRVDGLIFLAPLVNSNLIEIADRRGIPFVITHRSHERELPTFTLDNVQIVRDAINHLVSLGHRKIGHIYGSLVLQDGIERRKAFEDLLEDKTIISQPNWIQPGNFVREEGYTSALKILSDPDRPTALFCSNDEMAVGAYKAAEELGLNIPEDISIMGVDNAVWSHLIKPPLTTISQNLHDLGITAVTELTKFIEKGERPQSQHFGTELIVRASTSSPKEK